MTYCSDAIRNIIFKIGILTFGIGSVGSKNTLFAVA